MTDVKPLRAGVVGAGTGGMLSIKALEASERFELVGVADVSEAARARAVAEGVTAQMFADATGLLDASRPEVICVSTFAPSHSEIVGQAVDAGVRESCSKSRSPSTGPQDRPPSIVCGSQAGAPVVVPHGLLVRPASTDVLRHISEGVLGDLELIEIECRGWDLLNAGVHWVDFALAALRRRRGTERPRSLRCFPPTHIARRYRGGKPRR